MLVIIVDLLRQLNCKKFKSYVPTNVGTVCSSQIQSVRKSNGQVGELLCGVNSVVTSTHLLSQINALNSEEVPKEGHFVQVYKENVKKGSQVDMMEQENSFDDDCQGINEDVQAHFGSGELN